MPPGTAKWFDTTKGYGFIQADDGGRDVFVHVTTLEASRSRAPSKNLRASFRDQSEIGSGLISERV
ncbi:MAG: cold-shock protein [Alphaproteobacteria bacterium]